MWIVKIPWVRGRSGGGGGLILKGDVPVRKCFKTLSGSGL